MSRRVAPRDVPRNTARHRSVGPIRVLVADDHADTRALYAEYLTHCGMTVVAAVDGLDAIRAARSFRPDVALIDLTMPRADGITTIRALRATTRVVYLMTAFDHDPRLERARDVDRTLVKPCAPRDLAAWIAEDLAALARNEETG